LLKLLGLEGCLASAALGEVVFMFAVAFDRFIAVNVTLLAIYLLGVVLESTRPLKGRLDVSGGLGVVVAEFKGLLTTLPESTVSCVESSWGSVSALSALFGNKCRIVKTFTVWFGFRRFNSLRV